MCFIIYCLSIYIFFTFSVCDFTGKECVIKAVNLWTPRVAGKQIINKITVSWTSRERMFLSVSLAVA